MYVGKINWIGVHMKRFYCAITTYEFAEQLREVLTMIVKYYCSHNFQLCQMDRPTTTSQHDHHKQTNRV